MKVLLWTLGLVWFGLAALWTTLVFYPALFDHYGVPLFARLMAGAVLVLLTMGIVVWKERSA